MTEPQVSGREEQALVATGGDLQVSSDDGVGELTSVARIFRTLELLAEGPRTPSGLAQALKIDRSTALRLLRQLQATGYVARDDATKRYMSVGARLMRLVSTTPDHADLSELVDPVLRAVRAKYGEASLLAVPARGFMVYAAFFPSHHLLGVREQIGAARPMHCSAVGKAYLSGLDDAALEQELNRLTFTGGTDHAPSNRPSLFRQIALARQLGYAVDHDETSLGVSCVAVPLSIGDSLIGSIGVTGPTTRLSASFVEAIGPELREAATDLRYRVGRGPAG
jgi:DNA-binding IclR family transcriptional regulator